MHARNRISVPCDTVEARPANFAGALVQAVFDHFRWDGSSFFGCWLR